MNTEHAADAIVALINSRAQSPTRAEIAAIIAKVAGSPDHTNADAVGRLSDLKAAIRDVETLLDSDDESDDENDRLQAANRRLDKLTKLAWATPPHTLADLQERALIAQHCHRDAKCRIEGTRWVRPSDCDDWFDQGTAELIHAALGFAGALTAPIAGTRSALHDEIDRIANEYSLAYAIDGDPRVEPLGERLGELAAQLPQMQTPGMLRPTVADVAAWAEVAFTYAYEDRDDEEDAIFNADYPALNIALANLVTAARVLGEVHHG